MQQRWGLMAWLAGEPQHMGHPWRLAGRRREQGGCCAMCDVTNVTKSSV